MKGVLSWVGSWACHFGTRDFCAALAALVGTVKNIFSLTLHYFHSFVPIAQQARGRQPCRVAYLLICVSDMHGDTYSTSY